MAGPLRALRPLLLPLPLSPPATPSDPNQSKNTETKDFEKKMTQAMAKTTTSTIKAEGSDMDVKAQAAGIPTPAFSKHTPADSVDDISKHAYEPPAKPSVEQFAQQQLAASGSAPAAAVVLAARAHPAVAADPGFNRDSATIGGGGLLHAHGRQMAARHQPRMTHGSQGEQSDSDCDDGDMPCGCSKHNSFSNFTEIV